MRSAILIAGRLIADSSGWHPDIMYSIGITLLIFFFMVADIIDFLWRKP